MIPERSAAPSTRTGSAARSRDSPRALATTTAEPPSPIGEHISIRSGSSITRLASTSSTVSGSRYCAFGFKAPFAWLLTEIAAKSSTVAPDHAM